VSWRRIRFRFSRRHRKPRSTKDGTTTVVKTTNTATFSTAKGHEGEFLRATSQTATFNVDKDLGATNYHASDPKQISFGQAVGAIGANKIAEGVAAATPGLGTQFGRAVATDARNHPFRYASYAVELGLILTPIPEGYAAVEGLDYVKAVVDLGAVTGHVTYDAISP